MTRYKNVKMMRKALREHIMMAALKDVLFLAVFASLAATGELVHDPSWPGQGALPVGTGNVRL